MAPIVITEHLDPILASLPASLPADRRYVVAIAGAPASGKSTLAEALSSHLNSERSNTAILGLDAYHYDNAVLEARGLLARKGSIGTFDADAYRRDLGALREHPDQTFSVPVFDRVLELSRNCAEIVSPAHRILITEGNYLLMPDDPWQALHELFDLTIWIDAPVETLRTRLIDRWTGLGFDLAEAVRRAEENDLRNVDHVVASSRPATLRITST